MTCLAVFVSHTRVYVHIVFINSILLILMYLIYMYICMCDFLQKLKIQELKCLLNTYIAQMYV